MRKKRLRSLSSKMKTCNLCGITKETNLFGRDRRNKDGLQGICRECCKGKNKHRYYHNEEYRLDQLQKQLDRKRQRKLDSIQYKGGTCFDCNGTFHPSVYEFHQRDPAQKDFNLAHKKSIAWEKFKQELDKCILLCANCHRYRHWKEKNEN